MAPKRKGGNGRKKTVIRPIHKKDARDVCFSKRKRGLFSKASTLAMLSGAQVAAVVFSPFGNAFSFGHSSVDAVVNRFMAADGTETPVQGAADNNWLKTLHRQHGKMRTEVAERKKRKKSADEALAQQRAAGDQIAAWLDPDARDMGYEDMAAFAATLMQVQAAVSGRANQVLMEAFQVDISRQLFGATTFELGSSSSANSGIEMQAMHPPQGFADGMEMHPPQGFAGGMEMPMVMHPPQGFPEGMEMQMMMLPPQAFAAGMHVPIPQQQGFTQTQVTEMDMLMEMEMLPTMPEFPAGMDLAQQGLGPNPGFPY